MLFLWQNIYDQNLCQYLSVRVRDYEPASTKAQWRVNRFSITWVLQNILHGLMTNNLFHIQLNFKTHFAWLNYYLLIFRSIICQMALSIKIHSKLNVLVLTQSRRLLTVQPYKLSCTIYNAVLYRSLNKQFYQSKLKVICK